MCAADYVPDEKRTQCDHGRTPAPEHRKSLMVCPDCHTVLRRHPAVTRELTDLLSGPHGMRVAYGPAPVSFKGWGIAVEGRCAGPIEVGTDELRKALEKQGVRVGVNEGAGVEALSADRKIMVLHGSDSAVMGRLHERGMVDTLQNRPGFDGFCVQYLAASVDGDKERIVVWGDNERGVMYGCLHLAAMIERGQVTNELDIREAPYFKIRGGNMEGESNMRLPETTCATYRPTPAELLGLARLRANLVILRMHLARCPEEHLTYKYMDEVTRVPPGIEGNIAALREDIALAKRYGFMVCVQMSVWHDSYSTREIFEKHPDAAARCDASLSVHTSGSHKSKYARIICPSHPVFRKVIDAELRELFERYPEIDFITSWGQSDGIPMWCECEKCRQVPFSERQVACQTFIYDTIKKYKPGAGYIMGSPGLEVYGDRLFRRLPKGIYLTTWDSKSAEAAIADAFVDPIAKRMGNRYIPQLSRHTEAVAGVQTPNIRISGMQMDFMRYVDGVVPGVMDHHPFMIANFGHPEKYFDVSEPAHVAWFKFAWNPFLSADGVFDEWARERFPEAHERITEIYRLLDRVPEKGVPFTNHTTTRRPVLAPWTMLHPQMSSELMPHGFEWDTGLLLDRQAPYGYAKYNRSRYVFEGELRATKISEETLPTWIERFDFAPFAADAERLARQAMEEFPDNPHLPRFRLHLHALTIFGGIYRDYMEAGLRYQVALGLAGEGQREQIAQSRALLERCILNGLDCVAAPRSISLNWTRWAEGCADLFAAVAREWRRLAERFPWVEPFDAAGLLAKKLRGARDPRLGIGWQPEKEASPDGFRMLALTQAMNTRFSQAFCLLRQPDFYKEVDCPWWRAEHASLENVPRGVQWIWDMPFFLGAKVEGGGGDYVTVSRATGPVTIAVGEAFSEMGFLVSLRGFETPHAPVAAIRVRFANGGEEVLPIRRWREVTCWTLTEATPAARVGWLDIDLNTPSALRFPRGFNHLGWVNPRPAERIAEIVIEPRESEAALLVFAVTGKR